MEFLSADLFDELRSTPRRWLVTGAAGFIGSNLVECLLRANQDVVGLDNFSTGHKRNVEEAAEGAGFGRLRMITASFLVKDLLVDWRIGERHFAQKLLDYDLASNNGGWQWAASTGCDAQPWFRIFNPVTQSRRFDPQGHFIRRYLPQLAALSDKDIHAPWTAGGVAGYHSPVVDHAEARARTLERFGGAVGVSAPS